MFVNYMKAHLPVAMFPNDCQIDACMRLTDESAKDVLQHSPANHKQQLYRYTRQS